MILIRQKYFHCEEVKKKHTQKMNILLVTKITFKIK